MAKGPGARVRGFSLVELLVAIAIIGLTVAMASPRMFSMYREHQLRVQVQQMQRLLSLARSQAIATRSYVAVEFDLQVYPLPDRVRVLQNAQWNSGVGKWLGTEMQGIEMQTVLEPLDVQNVKVGTTNYPTGVHAIVFSPAGAAAMDDGSVLGSLDIEVVNMDMAA